MKGVSKISNAQNVMLITFTDVDAKTAVPFALTKFAEAGIVVDMICQSVPRGTCIDFSFTTDVCFFENAMQIVSNSKIAPLISRGYSKINLFGADMVASCGIAATALSILEKANIEIFLITTSDLDISILVREENEDVACSLLKTAFSV